MTIREEIVNILGHWHLCISWQVYWREYVWVMERTQGELMPVEVVS